MWHAVRKPFKTNGDKFFRTVGIAQARERFTSPRLRQRSGQEAVERVWDMQTYRSGF
jgi:hypothetical protein